jgi:hypothetical protein
MVFVLVAVSTLTAQETRQEEIRKTREAKAQELEPYKPPGFEAGLLWVEQKGFIDRLFNPPNGFFPQFGHMTTGAGFVLGPGYRAKRLLGGQLDVLATATVSHRGYFEFETSAALPRLANGRLFTDVVIRRTYFPQVNFYGLGPDSAPENRSAYTTRGWEVSGSGGVRPVPWLSVSERVEHSAPTISSAGTGHLPSVEERFTDAEAPGLNEQPAFLRLETRAEVDYRSPGPNARTGGHYLLSFHQYRDLDTGHYSFRRWDFDAQQYLSVLKQHRTLALRAYASFTEADEGREVPFYLQPWLGGSHMLRAYRSFRFRDRNVVLLQAEYRWEVLPYLRGALFYDAGSVAAERQEFRLDSLKHDYGFGLRFGVGAGVFLRTDMAFGGAEGARFSWRFNNVF